MRLGGMSQQCAAYYTSFKSVSFAGHTFEQTFIICVEEFAKAKSLEFLLEPVFCNDSFPIYRSVSLS